jgi:hypothetical protein
MSRRSLALALAAGLTILAPVLFAAPERGKCTIVINANGGEVELADVK